MARNGAEIYAWNCFKYPVTCFKVKSWSNRWLAYCLNGERSVKFSSNEKEACCIFLLPHPDGRYKLQVIQESALPQDQGFFQQDYIINKCTSFGTSIDCISNNLEEQNNSQLSSKTWFLCCRECLISVEETCLESTSDDFLFSLEFDEVGRVKIRGSQENDFYISTNSNGHVWAGTKKPQKWETFTLVEKAAGKLPAKPPWITSAPVRVTLQAHTGKYMCAAKPVVCARAEAPCCCEEFLIDFKFSVLSKGKQSLGECEGFHGDSRLGFPLNLLMGFKCHAEEFTTQNAIMDDEGLHEITAECTIRTADGLSLLSTEPDGLVSCTPSNKVRGMESFLVELHSNKGYPKVSIRRSNISGCYLSAEPCGRLVSRKNHRRKWESFGLQLANGSRVLIRSMNGGILAREPFTDCSNHFSPELNTGSKSKHSLQCLQNNQQFGSLAVWHVRSHGDSLYTLVAKPTCRRGADAYMFVDPSGRVLQSSDPAVHFPATASLFEIKPMTSKCTGLLTLVNRKQDNVIIGFTIRTIRKINGRQRYLSVEPNGALTATRLHASRWEIFQLIDVDAAAAAAAPGMVACFPASVASRLTTMQDVHDMQWNSIPRSAESVAETAVAAYVHGDMLSRAGEVVVRALDDGLAVPSRTSTSLQELCINNICWQASEVKPTQISHLDADEYTELLELLCSLAKNEILPVVIPRHFTDTLPGIPDNLLSKIWTFWRLRQHPQNSCKWLPSAFVPQVQLVGNRQNGRAQAHRFHARNRHEGWSVGYDGWHCGTCDHGAVLPMDPAVNPAHHRYLEFQSHVYSRAVQPTGILWNIISFAGVSIMSTALFCQIMAAIGRRSSRSLC